MIDEIQVKNMALIRQISLEPCAGLTVLTGETGAGKTVLLTAFKLLMGERGDKTLVRDGADELYVAGRLVQGDEELVAVRRLTAEGRNKVAIDGEMAGVADLATKVKPSIDLCSQNEHQQLTRVASHADVLDAWIGAPAAEAKAAYAEAYAAARAAQAALDEVLQAQGVQGARVDEARFTLKRIAEVNPKEGEYEELLAELQRAEHAETLARATDGAYSALSGTDEALGVSDLLAQAIQALDDAAAHDDALRKTADALRGAEDVVADAAMWARAYRDDLEFDAEGLAVKQDRVAAMQGLMRAFGPRMIDVFAAKAAAEELVSLVDDGDLRLAEARRAQEAAEAALVVEAQRLHEVRAAGAPKFAEAVTAQMRRLEMGSAQLTCRVEELPRDRWTKGGADGVEFLFKSGAGMTERPLAKIASGGEISRVMLSCKVVLGEQDAVDTLVFDEIDAGVGGATALAMAEVIADLARTHQVLVVTHLAQVAARASKHYVVRKSAGEVPETTLEEVAGEARTQELARMLGGTVTEASLAHAKELLGE